MASFTVYCLSLILFCWSYLFNLFGLIFHRSSSYCNLDFFQFDLNLEYLFYFIAHIIKLVYLQRLQLMTLFTFFYFILLSFLWIKSSAQSPIQGNSALFESAQKVVTLPASTVSPSTSTTTITVSKIQIPATEWRKPHISISSLSGLRTYQNKRM